MQTSCVILAAGEGSRMLSDTPKVLHEIAHAPLVAHALQSARALAPERLVVVTGHGAAQVEAAVSQIDPEVRTVRQTKQLGTGHAVSVARTALEGVTGDLVVLYGDTPFISAETLEAMAAARARADIVVLGFEPEDAGRYGRLVTQGDQLMRIVEYKDASPEERNIGLVNSGVMMADCATMLALIDGVSDDNAAGEYYLTDIVAVGAAKGLSATVVTCDPEETLGVNSRADLAQAEAAFQARARANALSDGVTLRAPDTTYFAHDTILGRDAVIEQNVVFGPGVTVETGATIRAFSHLEGCHVARDAIVGPFARLRPGAELAEGVRVGNFVEIKNAALSEGAKVNHLSYVGDADVGAGANLGAGTVTCNYDGVFKHRTTIGADAFIGSDTMLVAPVTIGDGAMTASGSTITSDVPAGALAVARAQQVVKPGLATRLMARLRALKASQNEAD